MNKIKDYKEYVGQKYGHLTILGVLPRCKDESGRTKPAVFETVCDCGKISYKTVNSVLGLGTTSCGCLAKSGKASGNSQNTGLRYKAKKHWECPYPAEECAISSINRICCHECSRPCKKCKNRPEKCGAKQKKER